MDIRFSHCNAPFVPRSDNPNIHWIPLQFKNAPHNSHVKLWLDSLPVHKRVYSKSLQFQLKQKSIQESRALLSDSEYIDLMISYQEYGVKAAGRMLGFE